MDSDENELLIMDAWKIDAFVRAKGEMPGDEWGLRRFGFIGEGVWIRLDTLKLIDFTMQKSGLDETIIKVESSLKIVIVDTALSRSEIALCHVNQRT